MKKSFLCWLGLHRYQRLNPNILFCPHCNKIKWRTLRCQPRRHTPSI